MVNHQKSVRVVHVKPENQLLRSLTLTAYDLKILEAGRGSYICHNVSVKIINPLSPNIRSLYPLKTSEKFCFSDVFSGYRNGTLC